jgi:cholesterol oxidase
LDPIAPVRPVVPAEAPAALRRLPIEPVNSGLTRSPQAG